MSPISAYLAYQDTEFCANDCWDVGSTSVTATRLLAARSDVRHIRRFPSDHHPAALTWKLIDLTAKQQPPRQEQGVKSAPRELQQFLKSVDTGRRHFISELLYDASDNVLCLPCSISLFV